MKTIALFILLLMPFLGTAQSYFNIDQPIARIDFAIVPDAENQIKITVTVNQETRETEEVRKSIDNIRITKVTGNVQWENTSTPDSELEGVNFYTDPNEYVWSSQLKRADNQQSLRARGQNSAWKRLTNVQVTYVIDGVNEYQTPYVSIDKCALLKVDDQTVNLQSSSTIYYNSQGQYTFNFSVVPNTQFRVTSVTLQEINTISQNELLTFTNTEKDQLNSFAGDNFEFKLAQNTGIIPKNREEYRLKASVWLTTEKRSEILDTKVTLQLKDAPKVIAINDPNGKDVADLRAFDVTINDENQYSFMITLNNAQGVTEGDIKLDYARKNKNLAIAINPLGNQRFKVTVSNLETLKETDIVYFTFKIKDQLLADISHTLYKNKVITVLNYSIFLKQVFQENGTFGETVLISTFNLPNWIENSPTVHALKLRATIEGSDTEVLVKWDDKDKQFVGVLKPEDYTALKTDIIEEGEEEAKKIIERKIIIKYDGKSIYSLGVKFLDYRKINELLTQLNNEVKKEKRKDRSKQKIEEILEEILTYTDKIAEATKSDLIQNAVTELAGGDAKKEKDAKKVLDKITEIAGWVGKFLPFAIALI